MEYSVQSLIWAMIPQREIYGTYSHLCYLIESIIEKRLVWGGLWQAYCDSSIIYLTFDKRIDLMLNVVALIIIMIIIGARGALGGDGCVYGLNGGNVSMDVYLSPHSASCTH